MSALVLVMPMPGPVPVRSVSFEMPKSSTLIEKLAVAPPDTEEVRGLEVAVNDSQRMGVGHGDAGLQHEFDGLLDGQGPPLLDPGGEIAALQVLHDHVRRAVLQRADVADASDVLALDLHRRPGFLDEPRHGLRVPEGLRMEELESDLLVELDMPGRDDDAHAAHTEDLVDPVLARDDIALVNAGRKLGRPSVHVLR